jgi:hypothetical protein
MDGTWTCAAAPEIARLLNREFTPASEPPDLSSCYDVLINAAKRLEGLAWLVPRMLSDE